MIFSNYSKPAWWRSGSFMAAGLAGSPGDLFSQKRAGGKGVFTFLMVMAGLLAVRQNVTAQTNYDNTTSGAITDNGCSSNSNLTRTFTVTGNTQVTDVNLGINITHANRGDITVKLTSPAGSTVSLVLPANDANDNYDVLLDSDVATALNDGSNDDVAAPLYDRSAKPSNSLDAFDGQAAAGTWTLTICDDIAGFTGTFNSARLQLTTVASSGASCTNYSIFALNYTNSTISRFNDAGTYINSPIASGLSNPNGAYQLNTGEVLICNGGNNTVLKYNPYTGASLGTFISAAAGGLQFPEQIKRGPDGYLYITAQTNSVVKKFDYTTGALIGGFTCGSAQGVDKPIGLAFIGTDMYVSNSSTTAGATNQIRKYNYSTGAYVSTLYTYPSGEIPRGMDTGTDGNLYVVVKTSTGARIDKFTMPAGVRTTFVTMDSGSGPYAGIKWGPDGELYIADYLENEVQRYSALGIQDLAISTNLSGPHFVVFVGCSALATNFLISSSGCTLPTGGVQTTVTGGVPPYSYLWSNGATTKDISLLSPGTYTLTVTDWSGVTSISSAVIADNNITSITQSNVVCSDNGTPHNKNDDYYTADITVAFNGKPSSGYLNLSGAATATIPVTATTTNTSHTFTGVQVPANGTAQSITATWSAQVTCTLTSAMTPVAACSSCPLGANAGADATICSGAGTTIGSASVVGYTYAWSPTTGLSSSTVSNPTASPTATTTYTVTVSNSLGCTQTDVVIVTVNPTPTASASSNSPCLPGTVSLKGGASGANPPYSYSWTGPLNYTSSNKNPSFTAYSTAYAGTYSVVATSSNGCSSAAAATTVSFSSTPANPGTINY